MPGFRSASSRRSEVDWQFVFLFHFGLFGWGDDEEIVCTSPRFEFEAFEFFFASVLGDDPALVHTNTQLLSDRIEAAIRKDVTQWFWMHKRWRVPENSEKV